MIRWNQKDDAGRPTEKGEVERGKIDQVSWVLETGRGWSRARKKNREIIKGLNKRRRLRSRQFVRPTKHRASRDAHM